MKTTRTLRLAFLIGAFVIRHSSFVIAQGPLTPPGAPAPTMKTLDQLEPRKEINATNTPGDGSNLFIISSPGSYYLSGNITGVSGKNGIQINADNVALDLHGFVLTGGGPGSGIFVNGLKRNLAIRNGTVRNWGTAGVSASGGVYSLYEALRLYKNGTGPSDHGIIVGGGSVLRGCISSYNTGHGFASSTFSGGGEVGAGEVVEDCVATGNGGIGFQLHRSVLTHCRAYFNSLGGITCLEGGSVLAHCNANANGAGIGISVGTGSTLTDCAVFNHTGTHGILAGEGSTLTNCTAYSNDVEFGIRADDRSTLTSCTASLNTSAAADSWGISAGAQCTISQCSVNGNLNTNGTPSASTGGGILGGNSCNIQHCTVAGNRGDGIRVSSDARVVGNACDSNGFPVGTGDGAGIHCTGADNRLEANNVTDNTRGLDVDSTGTLIIKNSASGNTSNFEIAASNAVGAIVVPAASAAISGNGAFASSLGSADPWANFSY